MFAVPAPDAQNRESSCHPKRPKGSPHFWYCCPNGKSEMSRPIPYPADGLERGPGWRRRSDLL